MTKIHFQKWQATGNDFVLVDNRDGALMDLSAKWIQKLCDRKFGVGADGFMLLQNHLELDFEMRYFNADGHEAEMCGNGARSIIGFALNKGIIRDSTHFKAIDGPHKGWIISPDNYRIKMVDVHSISKMGKGLFLNTGVPHLVIFSEDPEQIDVLDQGRKIRNSQEFAPQGTNVNFAEFSKDIIRMRTYERGVEDETLSCGTGAVACSIATEYSTNSGKYEYEVRVAGGQLKVSFERSGPEQFEEIYLEGEAKMVFEGILEV